MIFIDFFRCTLVQEFEIHRTTTTCFTSFLEEAMGAGGCSRHVSRLVVELVVHVDGGEQPDSETTQSAGRPISIQINASTL